MSDTKTKDLTAQVDGSTTTFITPEVFLANTLEVHHNGARLQPGIEFTERPFLDGFTWIVAPKFPAPKAGDTILVQYEVTDGGAMPIPLVVAYGIDPTI